MKELKRIYGHGIADVLTVNDDGFLKKYDVVTLTIKDHNSNVVSIAVSRKELIARLMEIGEVS